MRRFLSVRTGGLVVRRYATQQQPPPPPNSTVAGMPVPSGESGRYHEMFLTRNDPLHILGITPEDATITLVRSQYRVKLLRCDTTTKEGREKEADIKTAYELLNNPMSGYYSPTKTPGDPVRQRLFIQALPAKQRYMNGVLAFIAFAVVAMMVWACLKAMFAPLFRQKLQLKNARKQQDSALAATLQATKAP